MVELAGTWRAAVADDDLRRLAIEADFDDASWAEIAVPGHWRTSPEFADCDGPLLYRHRFRHHDLEEADDAREADDAARWWLTFEGAFTQTDIWLDGSYIGDTEGYFVPRSFEITEHLGHGGEHVLAVEVTSGSDSTRNLTSGFQWQDTTARSWNPGGIWRPVRIEQSGAVRLARLRVVCGDTDQNRATLLVRAELLTVDACTVSVHTNVGDGTQHRAEHPLAAGVNTIEWTVTVDRPRLWWPWSLGSAELYDVSVDVSCDGRPCDSRRVRTGLRQVTMRDMVLSVNGERMFTKGVRLGPTRLDIAEATAGELKRDIELAKAAGLDLVRCHAHVSRPELYDAADEAGMLIWQDVPLAGKVPRSVRKATAPHAAAMVEALAHHPSIALWCAHDRPDARGGPPTVTTRVALAQQLPGRGSRLFGSSVRRAMRKADSSRPVLSRTGALPQLPQLEGTDTELWLGWYQGEERELPAMLRTMPSLGRFVTGLGSHSVPTSIPEPQNRRWPHLDWEGLASEFAMEADVLLARFPPERYDTMADWAMATQTYQAELTRRQIETLRRLKYRPCGGFAYALLADAKPAISASLLDSDRMAKTAYSALLDACRPLIVVADRLPATVQPNQAIALDVHVVSDVRESLEAVKVSARLSWSDGSHAWAWEGTVEADSCQRVGTVAMVIPEAYGSLHLDLDVAAAEHASTNRYDALIVA
jgi:beta-mannosidase